MIRIKLHKKYMLTSDNKQFILNKIKIVKETKRDKNNKILYKKGDEILFPFAFYPSLDAAIKSIPNRIIMTSNVETIESLIDDYKNIINKLLGIDFDNFTKNNKVKKVESKSIIKKIIKKEES